MTKVIKRSGKEITKHKTETELPVKHLHCYGHKKNKNDYSKGETA